MPIDLDLSTFLLNIDAAKDSDTLVMRERKNHEGETSVRGRLGSFFTGKARYRETTQQFIDKFCASKGVDRAYATAFFEENLREHGAKPLQVRKVKAFLAAIGAKNTEQMARREHFRSVMSGSDAKQAQFQEVSNYFNSTIIPSRRGVDNEDFNDVLDAIKLNFLGMNKLKIEGESLFRFAQDILNDSSLSTEQCTRRLNLLMAFVDPNNPQGSFPLDYSDAILRCVFQQLLERTNDPNVNWNTSSDRILKNAFAHQASFAQRLAFVENTSLSTPQERAAILQSHVEELNKHLTKKLQKNLMFVLPTPSGMTEAQKREGIRDFLADPTVISNTNGFFGISFACVSYRTRNIKALVDTFLPKTIEYLINDMDRLNSCLPGLKDMKLDVKAALHAHPEIADFTFRSEDSFAPTDFIRPDFFLKMETELTENTEKLLSTGRWQFTADYRRTPVIPDENICQSRAEIENQSQSFAIFNQQTGRSAISTPFREISDYVKVNFEKQGIDTRDAAPSMISRMYEEELRRLSDKTTTTSTGEKVEESRIIERGKVFADSVINLLSAHPKQAAVALLCFTQNQDDLREVFNSHGGTIYDKGIILQPDGNVRVVYASHKNSPVHLCKTMLITPEGEAKIIADEYFMSTRPEYRTDALRAYQDMFANAAQERDLREHQATTSSDPSTSVPNPAVLGEQICDTMLQEVSEPTAAS